MNFGPMEVFWQMMKAVRSDGGRNLKVEDGLPTFDQMQMVLSWLGGSLTLTFLARFESCEQILHPTSHVRYALQQPSVA
jgi:hypothetical protein